MSEEPGPDLTHVELFVQGQSVQSNAALEMVLRVCEARLQGRYRLEVIDVQQQPQRIDHARVLAAPALIRRLPEPVLTTVGNFTEARVLQGLGLAEPGADSGAA